MASSGSFLFAPEVSTFSGQDQREVSAGAQFLTYANELSKTYATLTIERFLKYLQAHGIRTAEVTLKTDLGTELGIPATIAPCKGSGLNIALTPPSCPNANADVESVHATIEAEFFDAETFNHREEFFNKNSYLSTLVQSNAQESFPSLA